MSGRQRRGPHPSAWLFTLALLAILAGSGAARGAEPDARLASSLRKALCDSNRRHDIFELPPAEKWAGSNRGGYQKIGTRPCGEITIRGRLGKAADYYRGDRHDERAFYAQYWVLVESTSGRELRGWVFCRACAYEKEIRSVPRLRVEAIDDDGDPDLTFAFEVVAPQAGEVCNMPGFRPSTRVYYSIQNNGDAAAPASLELTADLGASTARSVTLELVRGLEPGEALTHLELVVYDTPVQPVWDTEWTTFSVDAHNEIPESDESNNTMERVPPEDVGLVCE